MIAYGRARIRRGARGWRVGVPMLDQDTGLPRVYVTLCDTWPDALDFALDVVNIGRP